MNNANQLQPQETESTEVEQTITWFPKLRHILGAMLFCWIVTFIFALFLGVLIGILLVVTSGGETEQIQEFINKIGVPLFGVPFYFVVGLVLWWGTKKSHLPSHEIYTFRPFSFKVLGMLVLIAFPLSILVSEVDNCVSVVFPKPEWAKSIMLGAGRSRTHPRPNYIASD